MLHLISKKDPTKMMLVALSEEDYDTMKILWDKGILFGAYSFQHLNKMESNNPNWDKYKTLIEKFPSAKGILHVNIVTGFAKGVQ